MSFFDSNLANLELPPAPPQGQTGSAKDNTSPTSVSGLTLQLLEDMKEPDVKKKGVCVSPTTRYRQTNEVRANSPTDKNRIRSPNFILRKRYIASFHKEVSFNSTSEANLWKILRWINFSSLLRLTNLFELRSSCPSFWSCFSTIMMPLAWFCVDPGVLSPVSTLHFQSVNLSGLLFLVYPTFGVYEYKYFFLLDDLGMPFPLYITPSHIPSVFVYYLYIV